MDYPIQPRHSESSPEKRRWRKLRLVADEEPTSQEYLVTSDCGRPAAYSFDRHLARG